MRIKLGLYKSMILAVLMCGSSCCILNQGDMRNLERFQRKVVSWITNSKTLSYIEQIRLSNLLPLPKCYELNDLLLLSGLKQNQSSNTKQPVLPGNRSMRRDDYFDLTKKTTRKISRRILLSHPKDSQQTSFTALTSEINTQNLKQMWNDIMMRYKPENVCTWHICCGFQHCRETWTNFI